MTLANNETKLNPDLDEELSSEQLAQVVGGSQDDGGEYAMHFLKGGGDVIGNQAGYTNGSPSSERQDRQRW